MPLYEFQCRKCNHSFEELLSVSAYETHLTSVACPNCDHFGADRLFTVGRMLLNTATTWLAKQKPLGDQFPDTAMGRRLLRERVTAARQAGRSVSMHDVWDGTVASSPDDPDGFIPHDDPAGHLKRVVAKRGVPCDSPLLKTPDVPIDPGPPAPMAEDLVTDHVNHAIKKNPDLAHTDQRELREQIREKHSYHKE